MTRITRSPGSAVIAAPIVGTSEQAVPAVMGAFLVSALGAVPGAILGLDLDPWQAAPAWLARLPRALGAGAGTLAAGSVLALLVALGVVALAAGILIEPPPPPPPAPEW